MDLIEPEGIDALLDEAFRFMERAVDPAPRHRADLLEDLRQRRAELASRGIEVPDPGAFSEPAAALCAWIRLLESNHPDERGERADLHVWLAREHTGWSPDFAAVQANVDAALALLRGLEMPDLACEAYWLLGAACNFGHQYERTAQLLGEALPGLARGSEEWRARVQKEIDIARDNLHPSRSPAVVEAQPPLWAAADLLSRTLREPPSEPALYCFGRTLRYAQACLDLPSGKARARQIAERLHALSLRPAHAWLLGREIGQDLELQCLRAEAAWMLGGADDAAAIVEEALRAPADRFGRHRERLLRAGAVGHAMAGRTARAIELWRECLFLQELRLWREAGFLPESQLIEFFQDPALKTCEDHVHLFAVDHADLEAARRLSLATALLRKCRSIDLFADTSKTILRGLARKSDRADFHELRRLRERIASLTAAVRRAEGAVAAELQQALDRCVGEAEAIESRLGRISAALGARRPVPGMGPPSDPAGLVDDLLARLAAALREDEALVEYVIYEVQSGDERQLRVLALVARARGGALDVRAFKLGRGDELDDLAAEWLGHVAKRPDRGARDPAWRATARRMFDLLVAPLLPALDGCARLHVAPDGAICGLPLLLAWDGRRCLLDRFERLMFVTTGRDLLRAPPEERPGQAAALIVADPVFDSGVGPSSERWSPMPATRVEADRIAAALGAAGWGPIAIRTGREASEAALRDARGPAIVHVATHGFANVTTGGNPLLSAGLALAGANQAGPIDAPEPDGIMSAYEVATLDLWGTRLAVLSACDSGLGEERRGQGVLGLQRALLVAGAETVVVSLWELNDEVGAEWMGRYYQHLMAGEPRDVACLRAARDVRKRHPHPYYWAPFVAIGRAEPLRPPGPFATGRIA